MKVDMPADADMTIENLPVILPRILSQFHACLEDQGGKIDTLTKDLVSKFDAIQASAEERNEATRKVARDLAELRAGELQLVTKQNTGLAKSQRNLGAQHKRLSSKIDDVAEQVAGLTTTVDQSVVRIQAMKDGAEEQTKKIAVVDGKVDFAAGQLDILRQGLGLPTPTPNGVPEPKVRRSLASLKLKDAVIGLGALSGSVVVLLKLLDLVWPSIHRILPHL